MVIFVDLAYSEHAETEMLAVFTYANELGFELGLNLPEMTLRPQFEPAEEAGTFTFDRWFITKMTVLRVLCEFLYAPIFSGQW